MIMFLFPSASSARCAETVCAVGAFYIFAGEGVEILSVAVASSAFS